MDNNSKFLKIFSECFFIKGYNRSIIYDLPRSVYFFIPNSLLETIIGNENKNCEEIYTGKNEEENTIIQSYIDFLKSKDVIFFCDEDELDFFPELDLTWDYPAKITNTRIDVKDISILKKSLIFIELLFCHNIQIVFSHEVNIPTLTDILIQLDSKGVKHIELVFPYHITYTEKKMRELSKRFTRLKSISIYNSKTNRIITNYPYAKIFFIKSMLGNPKNVQTKYIENFMINIRLFTESQKHHTYFNRKLYIGIEGEIKNAPECEKEFGYIQDVKDIGELKQIIASPEFQKYWYVNKDSCNVCKDCEFRHMCVDNRLPYQRIDGSWYHKTECNYNPYISKWAGEEGYLTLKGCNISANENSIDIDHKKIDIINEQLWEN